ncbi:MAG TPA: NAD(P)/FAD-dependent oxidoreductase [Marmoricola sp.]|nr:NAD(P)/FAD-dependent oxidoreductase [Marmoricola sp.]
MAEQLASVTTLGHRLPASVDVLVVGAGLSGIGTGHYLKTELPGRSFAIVEAADSVGGTWRTFRYPGIRSDSDMHTFGFAFKPWRSNNSIADSHEIISYLEGVIREDGLEKNLHFGYRVQSASWSSAEGRWNVALADNAGEIHRLSAGVLFSAAGYYDHGAGFAPEFEGSEDFGGQIIHPQFWPENFDYSGKRVVVIGSGATAVTLVPSMADRTEHITMLQRSPSYVIPIPRQDPIAKVMRKVLPADTAHKVMRKVDVGRNRLVYNLSQNHPKMMRKVIRRLNVMSLPKGYDVDTHFNPSYDPWDQRLCMVPDGDMFKAIRAGKADVVTDHIERFTPTGIQLKSGKHLDADVIITATGLNLLAFGGIAIDLDGEPLDLPKTVAYKAMMLSGVPNFAFAIGYTNISWTLKVDLVCEHFVRLLKLMDAKGATVITPELDPTFPIPDKPLLDFAAGYVQRSLHLWPRAGEHGPWEFKMDYKFDGERLRGAVEDDALVFSNPTRETAAVAR